MNIIQLLIRINNKQSKLSGDSPANFPNIGGSSNPVKVIEAMKLLLNDSKVKAVFTNIFGGITRCDDVAIGSIEAFNQWQTEIPVGVLRNRIQPLIHFKSTHNWRSGWAYPDYAIPFQAEFPPGYRTHSQKWHGYPEG